MTNGWVEDGARGTRGAPLCGPCVEWIAGVVNEVRNGMDGKGLLGRPTAGGRSLVFEDQCSLCRTMPGSTGSLLQMVATGGGNSWPAMFVCPSCDLWLAGLAEDGRSARGEEDRVIDGPYGEWPHPNLRELSVALAVADDGAHRAIVEAMGAMGVAVVQRQVPGAVLFAEVGSGLDLLLKRGFAAGAERRVLLAPLGARAELRGLLANGALAWLTIPVTPQQVTAALTMAMRQRGLRIRWDLETALPVAVLDGASRQAVRCVPCGATDRFELAWLLKRFSRGYDEVVMSGGDILLLPRVNAESMEPVIERLEKLLAGRCTFKRPEFEGRNRRFDVAG